jgi:hypothetical protein
MATLSTEIQNRLSSQLLVELTNPDDKSAETIDTDRLNAAIADAQAEFQVYCGVTYDNTVAVHTMAGIHGVIYYLHLYMGAFTEEVDKYERRWRNALDQAALVTGRNRILPDSTSVLTPTPEQESTEVVRPDMDRPNFDDLVTRRPGYGPTYNNVRDNR